MSALAQPEISRPRSVLDRIGGPDFDVVDRFHPTEQPAIGELATQLRRVCFSLLPTATGSGLGYAVTSRGQWRSLRDVSPAELIGAVRRAARLHPELTIPGDGTSVHRRIEFLFDRVGD